MANKLYMRTSHTLEYRNEMKAGFSSIPSEGRVLFFSFVFCVLVQQRSVRHGFIFFPYAKSRFCEGGV